VGCGRRVYIVEWAWHNILNHILKSHRVVTDSWFISPNLTQSLHDNGTLLLGKTQKDAKSIRKNEKNTIETYNTENVLVERLVHMTTFSADSVIEEEKQI